jgi:SfnB family sulfur acquisition oxidoreductase
VTAVAPERSGAGESPEPAHVIADEAEAVAAAHDFAARIRPGAAERDATGARPWDEIRDLAASGLLALTVPRTHGGPAVSTGALVDVLRIVSAADPAIGQIPQNHYVFVNTVARLGTPAQHDLFFGDVRGGALLGNALSERGVKLGVQNFETRLTRDPRGEGFRLSGRKYYCTGALYADWIPVMALDEDGRAQVAYVPRHAPGVEVIDDWSAMGQRGTASGTTVLTDVHVPAERVVPTWQTYLAPQTAGAFGQILHVAIDVGIAEEALADAAEFLRTRSRAWWESGVERAGDEPHLLLLAGSLAVKVDAARALLDRAAGLIDAAEAAAAARGGPVTADEAAAASLAVAGAKAFIADVAVEVATELFTLAGTAATDERWNLDRHWRNARTHTLHDPARWKYHHVGNWVVNGIPPPNHPLL